MIVELGNFNIPVILNSNQFSLGFGMHDLQLAKPNLVNISNSLFFEMIFVFFSLRSACFIFIETSTGRVVKCLPHVLNLTLAFLISRFLRRRLLCNGDTKVGLKVQNSINFSQHTRLVKLPTSFIIKYFLTLLKGW